MKFGLADITIQKINSVFEKKKEIEQVIIYGSRAKGNYREGSDIDITIVGENISDKNLSEIETEIDELDSPYLFDISIYKDIKSTKILDHIRRNGKVFYEKTK